MPVELAKVFTGHALHLVAPTSLAKVPASHLSHDLPVELYVPMSHGTQALLAPVEEVPAGQSRQIDALLAPAVDA